MTLPQFSLQGKTCVVTGAGKGMGQQFLTAFALSGARGAVVDLTIEAGEASIRKIKETVKAAHPTFEVELRAYACDVSLEPQVKTAWAAIIKDFGTVDVLVTAAGIVQNFPAEDYPYDQWQKMLDINLTGSFLFAQAAGKFWLDNNKKGNIILISSVSCRVCVRPQKQIVYNTVGSPSLFPYGSGIKLRLTSLAGQRSFNHDGQKPRNRGTPPSLPHSVPGLKHRN